MIKKAWIKSKHIVLNLFIHNSVEVKNFFDKNLQSNKNFNKWAMDGKKICTNEPLLKIKCDNNLCKYIASHYAFSKETKYMFATLLKKWK